MKPSTHVGLAAIFSGIAMWILAGAIGPILVLGFIVYCLCN